MLQGELEQKKKQVTYKHTLTSFLPNEAVQIAKTEQQSLQQKHQN